MLKRISNFLVAKKVFLIFLLLEIFSIKLVFNKSFSKIIFSKIFYLSTKINKSISFLKNYENIIIKNEKILKENVFLKEKILNLQNSKNIYYSDQITNSNQYKLINAKVINNTYTFLKNYITINKGFKHGIRKNMGVFTKKGVVGIVKNVSANYSIIMSLLHIDNYLSVKVEKNNLLSSLQWNGEDSKYFKLNFVPKSYKLKIGDEISTTGFDGVFPKNIKIGRIINVKYNKSTFSDITVQLYIDFKSLNDVIIISNKDRAIIEKLETDTKKIYGF